MAFKQTILTRIPVLLLVLVCQLPLGASARADDITQRELLQRLDRNESPLIVDVRSADEFDGGHVPGARNIPHTEIAARLDELGDKRGNEIVVYCESGRRAAIAKDILEKAGFKQVRHLKGDMQSWRNRDLPQEK